VEWGAFHALELSSSPKFSHKRLALLIGSLILPKLPELIILSTCQMKKNFQSQNIYDICNEISFASAICTKEITYCIEDDLQRLASYSKPCVRKRACVLARKMLLKNSELEEKVAHILIEKLKDDDVGVQIAATSAVLDCALVMPNFFVDAIPYLYKLFESKNNWLIIKVIQALCALLSAEKRLFTKLGEKLLELLEATKALSVELEIHKQIVKHFQNYPELVAKTKSKISNYIENSDPNIRYTGILVLKKLLKGNSDLLILFKDKLVKLFVSGDNTIKMRTLEIISENCNPDTFQEVADELIQQIETGSLQLKEEIISTLLDMIDANQYQNIKDFEWLFTNLKLLTLHCPPSKEQRLAGIIQDISTRIEEIRQDACVMAFDLLHRHYADLFLSDSGVRIDKKKGTEVQYNGYIISALMFIIGEYASNEQIEKNLNIILDQSIKVNNKNLREEAKISFLVSVIKLLFKFCLTHTKESAKDIVAQVKKILEWYLDEMGDSLEIYELLNFYYGIMKNFDQFDYEQFVKLMNSGYDGELVPVHAQSQALIKPDEKLQITEKMVIDQKEFDVLKENQMVKLLIEIEKMSSANQGIQQKPTGPQSQQLKEDPSKKPKLEEEKIKKTVTVKTGFALPPGASTQESTSLQIQMEIAKEEIPKGKKKVKVKKSAKTQDTKQ
jgi:hypothetical protein